MGMFSFDRPAHAAPRIWFQRAGYLPELLRPLRGHVHRWGELFGWGGYHNAALLAAATVAWRCGYKAAAAAHLAPGFARAVLKHHEEPAWFLAQAHALIVLAQLCQEDPGRLHDALARERRWRRA